MKKYIPHQKDIVWLNFDPATGKEIKKRRPAIVLSNYDYNRTTDFIAVSPITSKAQKLYDLGLLVEVNLENIKGFINPLQIYTYDWTKREVQFINKVDEITLNKVFNINQMIFEKDN